MDKRLIAAFTALLEIRDNAAHEIEHYTGADRVGEWLPLRPESINSFSSIAAELRNKIDAWRAFEIDEHALKPSPHRNVELLYRVFDAISATDAVLKDLEALHVGLLKFAKLLRERFESMRPAERDYWTNVEPDDTFEATEDWQQVLHQRRLDHVQSVLGMLPSHEHRHCNVDIWKQTGFAIAVADGIEWNAGTIPAGCFAWALDEIAGAEIKRPKITAPLTEQNEKKVWYTACLRHRDSEIQKAAAELNAKATERTKTRVLAEFLKIEPKQADSMIRQMARYERRNR